jgi:hypothetical protein
LLLKKNRSLSQLLTSSSTSSAAVAVAHADLQGVLVVLGEHDAERIELTHTLSSEQWTRHIPYNVSYHEDPLFHLLFGVYFPKYQYNHLGHDIHLALDMQDF